MAPRTPITFRLRQVLLRLALLCVAIFPISAANAQTSADLPAQVRAQWGILAELAGRDVYHHPTGTILMWRWARPGRELTWIDVEPGSTPSIAMAFTLQDDGTLILTSSIRTDRVPVAVNGDGSATINFPGNPQHIERLSDGTLLTRSCLPSVQRCLAIEYLPLSRASARVKNRAEERRLLASLAPAHSPESLAVNWPDGRIATEVVSPSTQSIGAPQPSTATSSVAIPGTAQAGPDENGALPSQSALRARWGVFADIAGRDLFHSSGMMDMFRWRRVGRELTWVNWGFGNHANSTVALQTDGSLVIYTAERPTARTPVVLNADGSVTIDYSGQPPYHLDRIADRALVSRLCHTPQRCSTLLLQPMDRQSATVRDRAERRRVSAGLVPADPPERQLANSPSAAEGFAAASAAPRPALPTASAPDFAQAAPISPSASIAPVPASPRIALVVGISTYGTLGNLTNPVNDARALAAALRAMGFDVELVADPNQRTLKEAISRLGERMGRAGRGATGLFFFAGHGIQSRGVNYLVPAGAVINREADLDLEAVPADTVLVQMQEAGVSTNIIILDACRNMPLTRSFRNGGRGLAQMDAPNGTFIAYSTAPGSVAADGGGANSPFATALLREMAQPGQPIETVFRNVRRSVLRETEGLQTPWDSSSLIEPFFFRAQ